MTYYKKITIASYDQNAKILSEKFNALTRLLHRYEFSKFISLLKGNKILDLGCGAGDHSLYFKKNGLDVVSIDLSKEMIALCKDKGIDAILMDIENIKFKNKTFDGIWAVTSLLHIPKSKLKKVIKKLNAILKDGGILYVCVKEGDGEELISDKFKNTKRFFAFFRETEIKQLFSDYFTLIEIKKIKFKDRYFLQAFFKKST